MATIQTIIAVNSQGTSHHSVGDIENGMKIHEIMNNSKEYEDHTAFIFDGLTKDGEGVFTLINVPVEIRYKNENGS